MARNWNTTTFTSTRVRTPVHWGRQSSGTGCPGSLSLWTNSKLTWTRSCITCSRWPCPGRGVILQRTLATLTILRSCAPRAGGPGAPQATPLVPALVPRGSSGRAQHPRRAAGGSGTPLALHPFPSLPVSPALHPFPSLPLGPTTPGAPEAEGAGARQVRGGPGRGCAAADEGAGPARVASDPSLAQRWSGGCKMLWTAPRLLRTAPRLLRNICTTAAVSSAGRADAEPGPPRAVPCRAPGRAAPGATGGRARRGMAGAGVFRDVMSVVSAEDSAKRAQAREGRERAQCGCRGCIFSRLLGERGRSHHLGAASCGHVPGSCGGQAPAMLWQCPVIVCQEQRDAAVLCRPHAGFALWEAEGCLLS